MKMVMLDMEFRDSWFHSTSHVTLLLVSPRYTPQRMLQKSKAKGTCDN